MRQKPTCFACARSRRATVTALTGEFHPVIEQAFAALEALKTALLHQAFSGAH